MGQHRVVAECRVVHAQGFLGDFENADAAHLRCGAAEVLANEVFLKAYGLEKLRAAIAHVGADTHLRHDLRKTLADGFDVVVDGFIGGRFFVVTTRQ